MTANWFPASTGRWAYIAATLMFFSGCSRSDKWVDGRPPVYPVSGQVVYQGKPLEGASVTFSPIEGTHGGAGQTDAEGQFSLTTFEANDGVPAGKYRVTVTKAEAIVTPHPDDPEAVNLPPLKVEQRHLIPEKYSSPETTELTAEVSASGENEFSFELVESDN